MSEPFLAEIRVFSFDFAPRGWAHCNGQLLPINQNQALFALLGTMYGGNGVTTFALPDLQDRVPVHIGAGRLQGNRGGEREHAVTTDELPTHDHAFVGVGGNATTSTPTGAAPAATNNAYHDLTQPTKLNHSAVASTGNSGAHENMAPSLALNFCIALVGIFPDRS